MLYAKVPGGKNVWQKMLAASDQPKWWFWP